jgi:hypothetical protein
LEKTGERVLENLAKKMNESKLGYVYDLFITTLIVFVSLKMDFLNKIGTIGNFSFNVGYVGLVTAAVSYNLTRAIHRKKNIGNWLSLVTNFISDIVSVSLGDYARVTSSIPNKVFTFLCGVVGLENMKDSKKRALIGLATSIVLVILLNSLVFVAFKNAKFTMAVATFSTLRSILSYTSYTLQITKNGMLTQISWTLYSISGIIVNLLTGNIPSLVKAIGYVPPAFLSIFTWKEKK